MKDIKPFDFKIDAKSPLPVYEQVKQEIKLMIISGYLEEGDRLMPIRELAKMLLVNTNTIVKVYYQLDIEGYIASQPGTGYFVKFEARRKGDPKQEIFEQITGGYISKALKLGYSLTDMSAELERRNKKSSREKGTTGKKKEKDLNKKNLRSIQL
ncbi:MAG: GntR family transcriptional regulator [Candidatus Aminicenantes bacterium]|nr:GntR family transcriptional regulator [Candidatus Aminicenantes bacterium]